MSLRRILTPLLTAVAVLIALFLGVAWIALQQARTAQRAGRGEEAMRIAAQWEPFHVWRGQWAQLRLDVLLTLFAQGRYAELLAHDPPGGSPGARLLRAEAQASLLQGSAAAQTLASIPPAAVDRQRYDAVRALVADEQAGTIPYVFDRNGGDIANYNLKTRTVEAAQPDFAPLVDPGAGSLTIGSQVQRLGTGATVDTTLDPFFQSAALAALGKFRGSIVAIDPRTNDILAIASNAPVDLALESEYEPGSVIKILTGLSAEAAGVDIDSMFPYFCSGSMNIDGRRFDDWLPQGHGNLASLDDALAVSCNIFFADLGLKVGRDRLERTLVSAGFGGQANLGLFQVPLGRIVGSVDSNYETAFLSIGLQHEQINALHLAMLASMMANRGLLTTPRLLRGRRSLFGDPVTAPPRQGQTRIATAAAAERMIRAMQAVVDEPRGTGHRAAVEGLTVAMKTGTAGDREAGLQAVIMAFAPVTAPKIAFAIIAEKAGPAEVAGAEIAHDFLVRIQSRL